MLVGDFLNIVVHISRCLALHSTFVWFVGQGAYSALLYGEVPRRCRHSDAFQGFLLASPSRDRTRKGKGTETTDEAVAEDMQVGGVA
jgi:hypothetical protein